MDEFLAIFHQLCKDCKTYAAAYELAETVYVAQHGDRKFKNLESFKSSLCYHQSKKKVKTHLT